MPIQLWSLRCPLSLKAIPVRNEINAVMASLRTLLSGGRVVERQSFRLAFEDVTYSSGGRATVAGLSSSLDSSLVHIFSHYKVLMLLFIKEDLY